MKAIVRRVSWAEVEIDAKVVGRIDLGLLVYVVEAPTDVTADAQRLAEKVAHLRVFEDETGRMIRSVQDAQGSILVVSDCTAVADVGEGHRVVPAGFAGGPAEMLYEVFVGELRLLGCPVATGIFGMRMIVRSAAASPANAVLDVPALGQVRGPKVQAQATGA
jgi:D-tyrosyl-tRNA(Tyr) deacylase